MPIYEYACRKCEHTLDALQKMSDEPLVDCPECGESALKRLISAPRFRLKGQGWYETDFKKDKQRNLLSSDTEPPKSDKSDGKSGDKAASPVTKASDGKDKAATPSKPAPAVKKETKTAAD